MRSRLSISSYSHAELKETHYTLSNGTKRCETIFSRCKFHHTIIVVFVESKPDCYSQAQKSKLTFSWHQHGSYYSVSITHPDVNVFSRSNITSRTPSAQTIAFGIQQFFVVFDNDSQSNTKSSQFTTCNFLETDNLTNNMQKLSLLSDRLQDPIDLVFCYSDGLS